MSSSGKKLGPDFIIIGAMKCMTTTLHDQLATQDGVFMTTPKEPCYFSDEQVYARGRDWYSSLFAGANATDLCGESSTHYTKLPTYPNCAQRLYEGFPDVRLIYVMRQPIDRLLSQYIHEWTQRNITCSLKEAINQHPELVQYSCFAFQIEPYLRLFGPDAVLPVFFERLKTDPQGELQRVGQFLGMPSLPDWRPDVDLRNKSAERMRTSKWRDTLVYAPGVSWVRQKIIPQSFRDRVKRLWQIRVRPELPPNYIRCLRDIFDRDLAQLGDWLGTNLTCESFREITTSRPLIWRHNLNEEFRTPPNLQEAAT